MVWDKSPITICQDGQLAGTGVLRFLDADPGIDRGPACAIEDCWAVLGDGDPESSDAAYEAIEEAIAASGFAETGEVRFAGHVYTWRIEERA